VAVEEYLKARPREWLALNAFRVNYLQGEKAWMRIEVVVQHRESWQNVGTVLDSKGNFMSYCTEVQKMLGIQYKTPHMPIELSVGDNNRLADELLASGSDNVKERNGEIIPGPIDVQDITTNSSNQNEIFRSLAQAKHNIHV
jgi:hypothetical protein